jgi:hypothetical protein
MKPFLTASSKTMLALSLAAGLTVGMPHARAAELAFSYEFASSGDTLSGTLNGSLEGDGNTFDVAGIDTLLVDGDAVPLPTLSSPDADYASINDPIEVTVDGSYLNIFGTDTSDAFFFSVGDALDFGVAATRGYGGSTNPEDYVQANWQASVSGVPEPSSAVILLAPVGLLVTRRANRKSAAAGTPRS